MGRPLGPTARVPALALDVKPRSGIENSSRGGTTSAQLRPNSCDRNRPHPTVPDADTCYGCHKAIRKDSVALRPLHAAYGTGRADNPAIPWVKVHLLPEYAYFHHAAHLRAGVGCASCHGRVDQMEFVRQVEPLSMGWCIE